MDTAAVQKFVDFANSHPGLFVLGVIWVMAWKGFALWRAAGRRSLGWFIAILVVNTLGLLEIFYLFFVAKPGEPEGSSSGASA